MAMGLPGKAIRERQLDTSGSVRAESGPSCSPKRRPGAFQSELPNVLLTYHCRLRLSLSCSSLFSVCLVTKHVYNAQLQLEPRYNRTLQLPELKMAIETLTHLPGATDINEKIPIVEAVETGPSWQAVANRRKDEIERTIPKEYKVSPHLLQESNRIKVVQTCGILTSRELSIISLTATNLLKCIHDRTFTAVEVTKAFCKSAAIAHQAVNSPSTFCRSRN